MKRTLVMVEVHHVKDVPNLAFLIADRTYKIDGVRNAEAWVQNTDQRASVADLERAGFTLEEIALGQQEIHR